MVRLVVIMVEGVGSTGGGGMEDVFVMTVDCV